MTRPRSSSGNGKSPPSTPTQSKVKSAPSSPMATSSPQNSMNTLYVQVQQRRIFLHHLSQWSLSHDSSLHFQGKISLLPQGTRGSDSPQLGKTVNCILTDATFTDARQKIVIKLFPPQEYTKCHGEREDQDTRRDSMDPFVRESSPSNARDGKDKIGQVSERAKGHYRVVIRCGAGWMTAREYFNKVYFSHMEAQQTSRKERLELDDYFAKRSQALGPPPADKDSITIRPLFRSFNKLPLELQEMVFMKAAGLSRSYDLCSNDYGTLQVKKDLSHAAISLSTMFKISKSMNKYLLPFIYHSTDFHFGLTGFTNFLWQSGPANRHEIRRLTFHFGKLALLHCIRWLAHDRIFALFEPPVATNPRSLQYFWRCQIQELIKDLRLFTLTINIKQIPVTDIPMIVAILKSVFGSIERILFVETASDGTCDIVDMKDERLSGLLRNTTWRELCLDYYQSHRAHSYFFKFELLKGQEEDVESVMSEDKKFFDTAFLPLSPVLE